MKLDNLDFNHIHINEESSDFNEICCVQMMFHIRKSKEILHFLVFYTDKIQEIIFNLSSKKKVKNKSIKTYEFSNKMTSMTNMDIRNM